MVYIGVDLHRKVSQLAVLDETGATLASHRIPSERGEFLRVFGELEPAPIEVAFEATYGWGWFADLLADAGVAAHMAHPLATKAIGAGRVKNDAIDAATLAHLLRTSLLPEAWIAPPEVREARRLVRMRVALVRIRSRLKAQVHAVCADAGVAVPGSDLFGRAGRAMLDDLALPEVTGRRLAAHLRLIDTLGAEIAEADREISRLFRHDPRVERLLPIPGVGLLTAATVVAEVWDVGRFPSADKLCSWAGLTPTERSSADHTRRGHISKQGSRWLRWIMVEAVSHLTDPSLRAFAAPIEARRGRKIARIALARRMLTLCYYALRDSTGCRAYPVLRPTSPAVTVRSPYGMASS